MNEPVDFSGECSSILQSLLNHGKGLNVHIECASVEKFITIMKEKPKIIHIMCHGDYDAEQKEFYLQFENEKAELSKLYPSVVKESFSGINLSETKLVFINACHSEMVGRAFLELGVECVIVAQSQLKLDDEYAKQFSKLFYDELIDGHSIQVAFDNAKKQLKAGAFQSVHSCCCGHKHTPNCKWMETLDKGGKLIAHAAHEPVCTCPNKMFHRHLLSCEWADEFCFAHDNLHPPQIGQEFFICCCSPELTHDETMKLLLLEKNPGQSSEIQVLD